MRARSAWLLAAVLLAGCASKSYCLGEQKYDRAASITPIHGGDGLQVPESTNSMRVPPPVPPDQDLPFGQRVANPAHKGHRMIACLDDPPPLPADALASPANP